MRSIGQLIADAERIGRETPTSEKLDPELKGMVLYGGDLRANVCFFARDLGKDEVDKRTPLIGASGAVVRRVLFEEIFSPAARSGDDYKAAVQEYALWTNTVPFKPTNNTAFGQKIRDEFKDIILELLVCHWQGEHAITLGAQALDWFVRNSDDPATLRQQLKAREKFEERFQCRISADGKSKPISLYPLPHPSPLNRKWRGRFPGLLKLRVQSLKEQFKGTV